MTRRSKYRALVVAAITANGPLSVRQLCEQVEINPRELARLTTVFVRESLLIRGPDMPSQRTRGGPAMAKTWDLFVGPTRPLIEPKRHWTEEQVKYVRDHYQRMPVKDIAKALGKSYAAVQAKAEREKLVRSWEAVRAARSSAGKAGQAALAAKLEMEGQIVVRRVQAPHRCHKVAQTLARLPELERVWRAAA